MSEKPTREGMNRYVIDHIDEAVEKDYIKVFYQPVVRTLTGELCHMEALARWDDPEYGLLSPWVFVSALEESEQIHKLDSYMVRAICREYRARVEAHLPVVPISFNLSWLDCKNCDMVEVVRTAVDAYEVPRNMIRVEFTESVLVDDHDFMREVIRSFDRAGFKVWMDDFGSGYSSLNVLKDFPEFHCIKFDMVFLSDFNERSKQIVSSLNDMAKNIGLHTLAEGVETEEQLEFLKYIGVELAQGYYFGKPVPYQESIDTVAAKGIPVEKPEMRYYHNKLSQVNFLSPTPFLFNWEKGEQTSREDQQRPVGIVEIRERSIRFIYVNAAMEEEFSSMGLDADYLEEAFKRPHTSLYEKFLAFARSAKDTDEIQIIDFMRRGYYGRARARRIASFQDGFALICRLENLSKDAPMLRTAELDENLRNLYQIFERIEIIDLNTRTMKSLYQSDKATMEQNEEGTHEVPAFIAKSEIYPTDQQRYLDFMEYDTLEQRTIDNGLGFTAGLFRMKRADGSYSVTRHVILNMHEDGKRTFLYCIGKMDTDNVPELMEFMDRDVRKIDAKMETAGYTDSDLLKAIFDGMDAGFFWKDRDRRFVGVNQYFLDYYGLKMDDVLGKNDEDMGWHVDPEPFMRDETRLLLDGEKVLLANGKSVARGKERDIVATKVPVYHNGKIQGLVGFFIDVASGAEDAGALTQISYTDPLTGTLNVPGFMDACFRFQEGYTLRNMDFAMIYFDIERFRDIRSELGEEGSNMVLRKVAEKIVDGVGVGGVVSHPVADRFLVLHQVTEGEDINDLISKVRLSMSEIEEVEGVAVTVYIKASSAFYSEVENIEKLYQLVDRRMKSRFS